MQTSCIAQNSQNPQLMFLEYLHLSIARPPGHSSGIADNTAPFRLDSAMCPGEVITLLCPALSGGTCRKSECDCSVPGASQQASPFGDKRQVVGIIPSP